MKQTTMVSRAPQCEQWAQQHALGPGATVKRRVHGAYAYLAKLAGLPRQLLQKLHWLRPALNAVGANNVLLLYTLQNRRYKVLSCPSPQTHTR